MVIAKPKQTPHTFPPFTPHIVTGDCCNRQSVLTKAPLASEF